MLQCTAVCSTNLQKSNTAVHCSVLRGELVSAVPGQKSPPHTGGFVSGARMDLLAEDLSSDLWPDLLCALYRLANPINASRMIASMLSNYLEV